mgnify:FL=1
MENEKRLVEFTENGGIKPVKEAKKRVTKQKNYIIDKKVADGIKSLSKQFGVTESKMLEEMYYTFAELLERGKQDQVETTTATTGKGKGKGRSKSKTANADTEEQIKGQMDVEEAIKNVEEDSKGNVKKDK